MWSNVFRMKPNRIRQHLWGGTAWCMISSKVTGRNPQRRKRKRESVDVGKGGNKIVKCKISLRQKLTLPSSSPLFKSLPMLPRGYPYLAYHSKKIKHFIWIVILRDRQPSVQRMWCHASSSSQSSYPAQIDYFWVADLPSTSTLSNPFLYY